MACLAPAALLTVAERSLGCRWKASRSSGTSQVRSLRYVPEGRSSRAASKMKGGATQASPAKCCGASRAEAEERR